MGAVSSTIRINDAATANLKHINASLQAVIAGMDRLSAAMNKNTAALNKGNSASVQFAKSQARVSKSLKGVGGVALGAVGALKNLARAYISFQTAKKVMQGVDENISNTARFANITGSAEEAEKLYNKVYQSAMRSRRPMNQVASAVGKLGINARDAFASTDEIVAFVETFNKAAKVSGSSASEQASALYQITQALASGRMQGDEFKSVRENAPLIMDAIEKELRARYGNSKTIQQLSSEGLITSDVIRMAVLKSQKKIEEAFKNVPMSFGDYWAQAFSRINQGLRPIYQEIAAYMNMPHVKAAITTIVNIVIQAGYIIWNVFKKLAVIGYHAVMFIWKGVKMLCSALWYLRYVIGFVIAVWAVYWGWMKLVAAWKVIVAAVTTAVGFAKLFLARGLGMAILGYTKLTQAQVVNLFASIKTIAIIAAIIAVIAILIYFLEYVMAAIYALGAVVLNVLMGCWNAIMSFLDALLDPFIGIAEFIYNCFNGGFTSWMDAVVNAFGQLIATLLSIVKPFVELWDMVFDTNAAATITGWQNSARGWGKNENAASFDRDILRNNLGFSKDSRFSVGDSWDAGYEQGKSWQNSMKSGVSNLWDGAKKALGLDVLDDLTKTGKYGNTAGIPSMDDLNKQLGTMGGDFGGSPDFSDAKALDDNTKALQDNTKAQSKEDDYELLRDVMAQRALSRQNNDRREIIINMTNNNNVSSKLDIKSLVNELVKVTGEAYERSSFGTHN